MRVPTLLGPWTLPPGVTQAYRKDEEVRDMMDGWDWFWGALMMLLFWGGVVALIVLAVRAASGYRSRPDSGGTTDARSVLEARFARGEISEEEFEHRRRVLGSSVRS